MMSCIRLQLNSCNNVPGFIHISGNYMTNNTNNVMTLNFRNLCFTAAKFVQ